LDAGLLGGAEIASYHAFTFVQFLRVAQGSLRELETHLIVSQRVGLLGDGNADKLLADCNEVGRMLRGLIRSAQARTNPVLT